LSAISTMANAHVLGVDHDREFDGSASAPALKSGIGIVFHVSLLAVCDKSGRRPWTAKVVADFLRVRAAAFA